MTTIGPLAAAVAAVACMVAATSARAEEPAICALTAFSLETPLYDAVAAGTQRAYAVSLTNSDPTPLLAHKQGFIAAVLPIILAVDADILNDRDTLLALKFQRAAGCVLSA